MTIEEFDPSIKLDYNDILNNIEINSHIGEEYLNKNQHLTQLIPPKNSHSLTRLI